ncbi:HEAT repeat domain-containing protein [Ktedonospora formicarum]|uniref:HEAT repeat domain-containing protein n=1 Tax=Ktedonospora formicarum TaxID=2778364 RepID=A0A8J3HWL7_9CHLR|nr:HEAT repeat domain-containing protein [Ktedonospora formicarum]GHO42022.1 hypothetical protein KSX_01850 [Ktedonospora formicarum]
MPLMNAPFPQPIIDQLASMDPKARRSALLKIKRSYAGFQANQFLIQMLATEGKYTNRALIIQILGERKWTAVVDALMEVLLKDESKKVRLEAVSVLCTIQDRRAVDVLLMALVQDKSMNVREKAAHALGEWQERSAIQTLENLLAQTKGKSSYASLRKEMAWALGQFGDPDLVMPLLKNEHHWVRDEAATALACMHDPQVIEPLLDFLSNPMESGTVRRAALMGLSKFQDERIIPALIFALEYRFSTEPSGRGNLAADILRYTDLDLCAMLLATLQNPQLATPRWEVIRLLGDIGDQRASVPLLAHVLAYEQWYLNARRGAYGHSFYNVYDKFRANAYIVPEALSKLCTEETFMQLLELLNAPASVAGVRDLCARTLALLADPDVIQFLSHS